MKSFRVKDLMINVMACQGCTLSCNAHPTCVGCTVPVATCHIHCTQPCTFACTHACTAACTFACTQACTHACTHACTFSCTFACTAACTFACTVHCTAACTQFCTLPHTCPCTEVTCVGCTHQPVTCHPVSILPQAEGEQGLMNLAALKEQLKQQLAEVEKQEEAISESLQPQTVSQVDQLMQKLQDAMEELKSKRTVLAQKEQQEKAEKEKPKGTKK